MNTCNVVDCGGRVSGHGFCMKHYMRLKRRGSVTPVPLRSERGEPMAFVRAALEAKTDDCIVWPFAKHDSTGYGMINVNGRCSRTHIVVCESVHKRPQGKYEVAHSCGNRPCINPKHLSWKTRSENQMDRVMHGTSNRGQRQWNHVLTDQEVREIRTLLETTGLSQRAIGEKYGVAPKTISDIHTKKTWGWLTHDSLVLNFPSDPTTGSTDRDNTSFSGHL